MELKEFIPEALEILKWWKHDAKYVNYESAERMAEEYQMILLKIKKMSVREGKQNYGQINDHLHFIQNDIYDLIDKFRYKTKKVEALSGVKLELITRIGNAISSIKSENSKE